MTRLDKENGKLLNNISKLHLPWKTLGHLGQHWNQKPKRNHQMTNLKITSINIAGLKSVERRQLLFNFCIYGGLWYCGTSGGCLSYLSNYWKSLPLVHQFGSQQKSNSHSIKTWHKPFATFVGSRWKTHLNWFLIFYICKYVCSIGPANKRWAKQVSQMYHSCLCSAFPTSPCVDLWLTLWTISKTELKPSLVHVVPK